MREQKNIRNHEDGRMTEKKRKRETERERNRQTDGRTDRQSQRVGETDRNELTF